MTPLLQLAPMPVSLQKQYMVGGDSFLVGGCGHQPYTTRLVRRPAIYTVIGFWWWGGSVADNAYWTLLAIVCHRIFIIILVEYRLGLLGIEMYHGFKRGVNPTDTSFAHLKRYAHAWCKGCAWRLQNCLSLKDASGGMAYLTHMSLLKKSKYCI